MADYELSVLEGGNTIPIVEGDNILTLGLLMPTPSFLGVPPSGSFSDGQVQGLDDPDTTVAQAIDELNAALKTVATTANEDFSLGAPTDGSFADGYVDSLAQDMRPVDAIDLLNEGLLEVSQAADAPATMAQTTGGRDVGAGQVAGFTPETRTADAIVDLNLELYDVVGTLSDTQDSLEDLSTLAHAPGQQPAGTPTGGWAVGYSTLTAQTGITDALNLLNQGLWEASTVGNTAAQDLALLHDEVDLLSTMAQSPGQQPLGTPTGGWQAGHSPLGTATLVADSINILNQGLGAVAQTAAAPGSQGAGTPTGGWSVGYAPLTASTPINGALNAFNTGLLSVSNTAAAPGQQPSGAPTGGWQAGQASLTNATLITDALNSLNVALKTVASTPPAAASLGAPTDGSYADGLVALDAAMAVGDALDSLNEGTKELTQGTRSFGNLALADSATVAWAQRAKITSPSDGLAAITNNAGTLAGIYQAALFQAANADGAVQFGNAAKTNGLAIGADTVALKVANNNALAWTFGTAPAGTLSGTLTLARAGTAAAPTLGFSATDGLFAPAAGDIGIATGGVQRMRFGATGIMSLGGAEPVAGTVLNMTSPNILSSEYTFSIMGPSADRWLRWRNDGRLMVQPYMQCNNVVLGIWGNSAIGNTTGGMLDFSNNIATTPMSLVSAANMSVNPTFLINAKSSANTLDLMRWQQNGTTVVTMANAGALSGPGFHPNATQAAAGSIVYGDIGLLNGMGVNTTNNSVVFKTNNVEALVIDNAQNQTIPAASGLLWNGRGGWYSTGDGVFQARNVANTAATIIIGPTTSSGVRLVSSSNGLSLLTGANSDSLALNTFRVNAVNNYSATFYTRSTVGSASLTYHMRQAGAASVTLTGASVTTSTNSYDAGCQLVALIVRITTPITGGVTGFNVGDTGTAAPLLTPGASLSATAFGANVPVSYVGSTGYAHYTVPMPRTYGIGAITFTITPVGAATFTGGVVSVSWITDRVPALTS